MDVKTGRVVASRNMTRGGAFRLRVSPVVYGLLAAVVPLRAGEESVAILGPSAEGHVLSVARAALALTMREAGRSAAEAEPRVEGVGGWSFELLPAVWRVRHHEALVKISLAVDDVDEATEFARLSELAAQELGLPVAAALAQRARAAVLLAQGEHAQAIELALASASGAAQREARVEARALADRGRPGLCDGGRQTPGD